MNKTLITAAALTAVVALAACSKKEEAPVATATEEVATDVPTDAVEIPAATEESAKTEAK